MKKKINQALVYLILSNAFLFLGCKKDKDEAEVSYTVTTYKGINYDDIILPNTTLYFYKSGTDAMLEQNLLFTKTTDENGKYSVHEMIDGVTDEQLSNYYYVSAKKDTLNTKRQALQSGPYAYKLFTMVSSGKNGKDKKASGDLKLYLSTTPAKLRLVVYHLGQPAEGAKVQLYKSEADYNSDTVDDNWDLITGNSLTAAYTDENGEVYFDGLEVKPYWFRITKDNLSNSGGTFSTDGSLPDNVDVTTQLSLGIN